MAYSDGRASARPNPASIGGAILINGMMIAGIIMLKPDIIPDDSPVSIVLRPLTQPAPPPRPVDRTKADPDRKTGFVPVRKTPSAVEPETDIDVSRSFTGGDIEIGNPGGGLAGPEPVIIEPIVRAAQIHPKHRDALQPAYPGEMVRAGVEGFVTIRVLIGVDGRVKAVEPVAGDGGAFLEATRKQALTRWRFLAATRDGEAIESWREMTVRFQLPD